MKEDSSPFHDFGCACATARQVARVLTQFYDSKMRDSGVEPPQFGLLVAIEKGASTQVALVRHFALDKTTVSRNLKLLESNGLIELASVKDKRTRRFVLTAKGRDHLARAKPKWKEAQNQLRSAMTADQWSAMFATFRTIVQAAQSLEAD
jgi:DNA-binding MarR family transcriptional regulator